MNTRHTDDGTTIHDFTNRFLVRCPECQSRATVVRDKRDLDVHPWRARFCCTECVTTKDGKLGGWSDREPVDWVFGYDLWLQMPCCGHTLWAYNQSHLRFLESYVSADHRIGLSPENAQLMGVRNSTLASSLPSWMISRKNRESVLRPIRKLMAENAG